MLTQSIATVERGGDSAGLGRSRIGAPGADFACGDVAQARGRFGAPTAGVWPEFWRTSRRRLA